MRAILSIFLSLLFVLQGHAFDCVADACQKAIENTHQAQTCCENESPAQTQACCCEDEQTCEDDCNLESHTHRSVLVFEGNKRSPSPTFAALSKFNKAVALRPSKTATMPRAHAQAPPSSDLLLTYCVWRL